MTEITRHRLEVEVRLPVVEDGVSYELVLARTVECPFENLERAPEDDPRVVVVPLPATLSSGRSLTVTARVPLRAWGRQRQWRSQTTPLVLPTPAERAEQQAPAPPVVNVDVHVPEQPAPLVQVENVIDLPDRKLTIERGPQGFISGATIEAAT